MRHIKYLSHKNNYYIVTTTEKIGPLEIHHYEEDEEYVSFYERTSTKDSDYYSHEQNPNLILRSQIFVGVIPVSLDNE